MTATVRDKSLAGSWIDGVAVQTGGPAHRVINPADGSVVAELALATPGDVDRALEVLGHGLADAVAVAVTLVAAPIWTALLAWWWLGERPPAARRISRRTNSAWSP